MFDWLTGALTAGTAGKLVVHKPRRAWLRISRCGKHCITWGLYSTKLFNYLCQIWRMTGTIRVCSWPKCHLFQRRRLHCTTKSSPVVTLRVTKLMSPATCRSSGLLYGLHVVTQYSAFRNRGADPFFCRTSAFSGQPAADLSWIKTTTRQQKSSMHNVFAGYKVAKLLNDEKHFWIPWCVSRRHHRQSGNISGLLTGLWYGLLSGNISGLLAGPAGDTPGEWDSV